VLIHTRTRALRHRACQRERICTSPLVGMKRTSGLSAHARKSAREMDGWRMEKKRTAKIIAYGAAKSASESGLCVGRRFVSVTEGSANGTSALPDDVANERANGHRKSAEEREERRAMRDG
jgi:hypothetical protein